MKTMTRRVVARWESGRGAHYVEIHHTDNGYGYRARGAGGSLGFHPHDDSAIAALEPRILSGQFQPDVARTPMKRVR